MNKKKLADKLFLLYREETNNNKLQLQFRECLNILLARKVSTQILYELFHEFGHYTKAIELGATVVFVSVSSFVFTFNGKNVRYIIEEGNDVSATLSYFEDETNLLDNVRATIYNGMHYSKLACDIKTTSLRVYLFNKTNSPGWKRPRQGSDNQLYKQLITEDKARDFNTYARNLASIFEETGSVLKVVEASSN